MCLQACTGSLQVADEIEEQKLDLTEAEFALLLQACARGNASWQTVHTLLTKMTKELTRLQPETLAAAEQYFRLASLIITLTNAETVCCSYLQSPVAAKYITAVRFSTHGLHQGMLAISIGMCKGVTLFECACPAGWFETLDA